VIANVRFDASLDELCAALIEPRPPGSPLSPLTTVSNGSRTVCPVSRARDALRWVLARCGIGAGDHVLVPDLMCETAGEAVAWTGARVVTYGLVPGTLEPSPEYCERAVTPATRALIVPHLYGIPARMDDFSGIAERHGLLLIEDSALIFPGQNEPAEYRSPAPCVIYSFNYGKPLSLGWGGLISLAPELVSRISLPAGSVMNEEDDRFYAAALLLGQAATDAALLGNGPVSAGVGLHLLSDGGGNRPATPDWGAVDEVLRLAQSGSVALLEWVDAEQSHRCRSQRRMASRASMRIRAQASRLWPLLSPGRWARAAVRMLTGATPRADDALLDALLPGGLAERLLDLQWRQLREEPGSAARRAVAQCYEGVLDSSKWLFPAASQAAYWLSYPVAATRPIERDRLVGRIANGLGVDVHPYVWPDVLHRVPHLRRAVWPGPGSEESAKLVDALLNLPVHPAVPMEKAQALAELLNREA